MELFLDIVFWRRGESIAFVLVPRLDFLASTCGWVTPGQTISSLDFKSLLLLPFKLGMNVQDYRVIPG